MIDETTTLKEFLEFNDENENKRFEFIGGCVYAMASPSVRHADVVSYLHGQIWNYLRGKKSRVQANLDVHFLLEDGSTNVLCPDLLINCKPERYKKNWCQGAPEFALEVVSPSSALYDYYFKKTFYIQQGVKEYWIVDPNKETVQVVTSSGTISHSFRDEVKFVLFKDLAIDFNKLSEYINS
jgi:Uma2 family endonuclease